MLNVHGLNFETCTTTVNLPSYDPGEDRIEGRFWKRPQLRDENVLQYQADCRGVTCERINLWGVIKPLVH